ncbi:MAG: cren protein [Thermoprotei archaeon]
MKGEIEKVISLRTEGPADIARVAAAIIVMGQPMYLIHFKHDEKHVYGMLAIFHDYYGFNGIPIFYYFISESDMGKYLLVKVDDSGEYVRFSDKIMTGWTPIPIMTLTEKPSFIQI